MFFQVIRYCYPYQLASPQSDPTACNQTSVWAVLVFQPSIYLASVLSHMKNPLKLQVAEAF
jgi:hypothetical protein